MSEKSILNLLSSVAILKMESHVESEIMDDCHLTRTRTSLHRVTDSRSPVVVNAVDLAADEDADPAVAPLVSVGQQEGNEQSQTCKGTHTHTHCVDGKFRSLSKQ